MVAHPRAPHGPDALQALNLPKVVQVWEDTEGRPLTVRVGRRRLAVGEVADAWRIDDEWWRERPVSRLYYRVLLEGGETLTVFQDLVTGVWYRQQV